MRYAPSQMIRARARESLLGHYSQAVPAYLSVAVIEFFIYFLCASFVDADNITGRVIYAALNIFYMLVAYIFSCGAGFLSLKLAAGQDVKASDLFQGFRTKIDICARLFLIRLLISALCFSPTVLFATLLSGYFRHSTVLMILSVLLCLGIVLSTAVMLALSQVTFIMWDYPGYGLKRIMSTSIRIMKGNRLRLLYLVAGFIPLYILCLLSCGTGFLWLVPYFRETLAQFYLEIVRNPVSRPETPSYPASPGSPT